MSFELFSLGWWVLILLTFILLPIKGYALWIAAKNSHKWWFVALLIFNTLAILEIIYIFTVGRPALKKSTQSQKDPTKRGGVA